MRNLTLNTLRASLLALSALLAGTAAQAAQTAPADSALVARGAYLAKAGDCVACHTAPRGTPFAGGLKMVTPMGAIYTTNITDQTVFMARYTEKVASRMLGGCKMFKFFGADQRLK